MGVAVNPDIDLRFFMSQWHYGFAVTMERGKMPTLYAFQFFNENGEAVHKIYSTNKSDVEAYHQLVDRFKAVEQTPLINLPKAEPKDFSERPDESIDVAAFQQEWLDLKDTHHFFGMLRKYELSRTQAFRLAPEGHTIQVDNQSIVKMLEKVAEQQIPIMCFLHSKGCVQIHTGEVNKLKWFDNWFNIMDPDFNMHLNMDGLASSWIVKKPTEDGIVTSLELFDENGELIVYFFGKRKPGIPELDAWRSVIDSLTPLETV
ncbi:MAG: ChuX/HutX family heme-like substrate-binding protein [Bacteroidota bacterium]